MKIEILHQDLLRIAIRQKFGSGHDDISLNMKRLEHECEKAVDRYSEKQKQLPIQKRRSIAAVGYKTITSFLKEKSNGNISSNHSISPRKGKPEMNTLDCMVLMLDVSMDTYWEFQSCMDRFRLSPETVIAKNIDLVQRIRDYNSRKRGELPNDPLPESASKSEEPIQRNACSYATNEPGQNDLKQESQETAPPHQKASVRESQISIPLENSQASSGSKGKVIALTCGILGIGAVLIIFFKVLLPSDASPPAELPNTPSVSLKTTGNQSPIMISNGQMSYQAIANLDPGIDSCSPPNTLNR